MSKKKLKVIELFSGIGSQTQALKNIGVDHEVVAISEIDRFAIESYETVHGKVNNLGDVSKIDPTTVPEVDLLTYSFPCTDISSAGLQKGFFKGSGTRSGLLWECEKIIKAKKPKYLLMENVKALTSKKFISGFQEWVELLDSYGYKTTYTVMNAKDYGVPQNRERVFAVSILQEGPLNYEFPTPIPLKDKLKDILEYSVDEKYYLKNEKAKKLLNTLIANGKLKNNIETSDMSILRPDVREISNCITARYDAGISAKRAMQGTAVIEPTEDAPLVKNPLKGLTENGWHFEQQVYSKDSLTRALKAGGGSGNIPKVIEDSKINQLGNIVETDSFGGNPQRGRVYGVDGISPALNTVQGGGLEPKIVEEQHVDFMVGSTQKNAMVGDASISAGLTAAMGTGGGHVLNEPFIAASRGRNLSNPQSRKRKEEDEDWGQVLETKTDGTSNTLTTVQKDNYIVEPTILRNPHGYNDGGEVKTYSPSITTSSWENNNLLKEPIRPEEVRGTVSTDAGPSFIHGSYKEGDVSKCILTKSGANGYRIRKLTPKECWRLMGFDDEQFDKTQEINPKTNKAIISNAQLYKQAGNSIVVDVLENIFYSLLKDTEYKPASLPRKRETIEYYKGESFISEDSSTNLFDFIG